MTVMTDQEKEEDWKEEDWKEEDWKEERTQCIYLFVLETYAPNFAKLFNHPGVKAVKLDNVTASQIEGFLEWVCKRYEEDQSPCGVLDWEAECGIDDCWSGNAFLSTDLAGLKGFEFDAVMVAFCVDMFIFAEAYDITILRLDSINRLVLCFDYSRKVLDIMEKASPTSTAAIRRAYKSTSMGSPLRRVLVAGFGQGYEEMGVDMPGQFLVDMVTYDQGEGGARGMVMTMPSPCEFHEHDTEEEDQHCRRYEAWLQKY
jgi:hypothetical protein